MEIKEKSEKIGFWESLASSFACLFLSILILDPTVSVENIPLDGYLMLGAIALIPAFFIHLYGIKSIKLLRSIPIYIVIIVVFAIGYFIMYGEHTYEDCILNHTTHSIDESATHAIKMACRKKYKS
jgi:hypothetical protein